MAHLCLKVKVTTALPYYWEQPIQKNPLNNIKTVLLQTIAFTLLREHILKDTHSLINYCIY